MQKIGDRREIIIEERKRKGARGAPLGCNAGLQYLQSGLVGLSDCLSRVTDYFTMALVALPPFTTMKRPFSGLATRTPWRL